jgi:crossover junction endodeoxyribonuclease RuvC
MPLSCVLGIDPGAQGAVAILDVSGQLIAVEDMPATQERSGRYVTDAALLSRIIAKSSCRRIYCEFVSSRPNDGVKQAFAFGRARGIIEGIGGAFDLEVVFIPPPVWKRYAQVPPGKENKDQARTRAIARWPQMAEFFALKKHVDRAEAAFVGAAGLARAFAEGKAP